MMPGFNVSQNEWDHEAAYLIQGELWMMTLHAVWSMYMCMEARTLQ